MERDISTTRLRGRAGDDADRPFVRSLLADPRVAATLWPGALGGPRTAQQSDALLDDDLAHWERDGLGPWIFRHRESGEGIGRGGLERTTVEGSPATEILYAVASEHWGRGYATEIAAAALEAARGVPGLTEVVAFTLTTNRASQRVMKKIGLVHDRAIVHAGLPHVLSRADL